MRVRLNRQIRSIFLNLYKILPFTCNRLKYLLQVNNLFLLDEANKIKLSAEIAYRAKKDKNGEKLLIIDIYYTSSKEIDLKIDTLQSTIQSLFNREVLEKEKNYSYMRFICPYKRKKEKEVYYLTPIDKNTSMGQIMDNEDVVLNKRYTWNYKKEPHMLVSGSTGSGKSRFLYYIIHNLIKNGANGAGAKIWVCDGKQEELKDFANYINVDKNAQTYEEIREIILAAEKEMLNRTFTEPLFLVIDELATLNLIWSKSTKEEVTRAIKNLALRARSVNVHILLALQRPSSENMSLDIRDSMNIRIGLGNLSKQAFEMTFGVTKDEEIISRGSGEGYLCVNGAIKLFDCPIIKFPNEE